MSKLIIQGFFDNVVVFWEGMEWAKCLGLKSLFIKLEFEKTYDNIEWSLILALLQVLCFGNFFIQMMDTLFLYAQAYLYVNQDKPKEFGMSKLISQGFPLSLTLYLMVVEALNYLFVGYFSLYYLSLLTQGSCLFGFPKKPLKLLALLVNQKATQHTKCISQSHPRQI